MDKNELRRLAEGATAGPWDWLEDGRAHVKLIHVETPVTHPVAAGLPICSIPSKRTADAAFIAAANPQTVLALLDRIETLEKGLEPLLLRANDLVIATIDYASVDEQVAIYREALAACIIRARALSANAGTQEPTHDR